MKLAKSWQKDLVFLTKWFSEPNRYAWDPRFHRAAATIRKLVRELPKVLEREAEREAENEELRALLRENKYSHCRDGLCLVCGEYEDTPCLPDCRLDKVLREP